MSYYNDKNLELFREALREYANRVKAGEVLRVSISNSNSKMGAVASVSTLPFMTCPSRCASKAAAITVALVHRGRYRS